MADEVTALEFYRLPEPEWHKAYGQGPPPEQYTHIVDGEVATLVWGETVQASAQIKGLQNRKDHSPPKTKTDVLEAVLDRLQLIQQ